MHATPTHGGRGSRARSLSMTVPSSLDPKGRSKLAFKVLSHSARWARCSPPVSVHPVRSYSAENNPEPKTLRGRPAGRQVRLRRPT
eukprot:scaffold52775_cov36-Phaeocystis_antarctica.AAC.1